MAYRGDYVFVNKDAKNIDTRDKDEAFAISSHVTHTYYHWAKHRGDKKSNARARVNSKGSLSMPGSRSGSPSKLFPRSKPSDLPQLNAYMSSWASFPTGADKLLADASDTKSDLESSKGCSPGQEPPTHSSTVSCPEAIVRAAHAKSLSLPLSALGYGNSDPFDSTAIPITPIHNELMHIWHCYFMSFSCPLRASSRLRAVAERKWHSRVADLIHDETELNAWFASALIVKAKFFRPDDRGELMTQALEHQSKALVGLRERVQSDKAYSERLLLTIWSLATVDAYTGDSDSNLVHYQAINQIVDSMGGLEVLSLLTRLHVIVADIVNANFNLQRPIYDFKNYDPGSWAEHSFADANNHLLPIDHTHFGRWDEAFLNGEDALSANVSDYLNHQREFVAVQVMTKTMSADRLQQRDDILGWLHGRRMALRAMCAEIWCDLEDAVNQIPGMKVSSSSLVRRRTQQSIMLAANWLVWFTMNYENDVLPKWMMYIPFPNLRKSFQTLLDVMASRGKMYNMEALLWLAFVGASSEEASVHAGARLGMDEGWCMKRFVTLARKLHLRTWREAKRLLKRFVYDEMVLDRFAESHFAKRDEIELVQMPHS